MGLPENYLGVVRAMPKGSEHASKYRFRYPFVVCSLDRVGIQWKFGAPHDTREGAIAETCFHATQNRHSKYFVLDLTGTGIEDVIEGIVPPFIPKGDT